jgi:histidyl-tRNA synthetase
VTERIQAVRGMNDTLPDQTPLWRFVEQTLVTCLMRYGYQEIRFPLVESTHLFKRTLGDVTDIVEKEMYTFKDLNGESITLRPEGTAGCVRACLEHGLLHNQQQKLWYLGSMFRHERPQKGRYRQFNQLGVEVFGIPGTQIELELILLCRNFWTQLGFANSVQLQVNTLGDLAQRKKYKEHLIEYLSDLSDQLDEDSKRRLTRNPLRILDSKNPEMQRLITNAPKMIDMLEGKSLEHFQALCQGLDVLQIPYTVNPVLVRGLDYYGQSVFEWVTDYLGSQATICAGGRYDSLVEQLGGNATPSVGFALGLERLVLLMERLDCLPQQPKHNALFIIGTDEEAMIKGLMLAESIRKAYPEVDVIVNTAGGSFKSQFKKADKSGARLALILGEEELAHQKISIKDLRKETEQVTVDQNNINQFLADYLLNKI